MSAVRSRLRPLLAGVLWPALTPLRPRLERARDGSRLKPGIAAVVAARDEAFTVDMALRSLLGVADQVVCVDNGSVDGTLEKMYEFRDGHGDRTRIDVISMPGALLGDCREAGLGATRHQWHLRWDADMVAKTSGPESMIGLRDRLLEDARPRTIALPRTNLIGDLRHTRRLGGVVDAGEPILVRFGRYIAYREFGRFDALRVPLYYAQHSDPGRYYFHLAGLKSDENLIHRFHYFAWRELVNREGNRLDPELLSLETFKQRRNLELFGTNDPCALKFRYQRQLSYHLTPYEPERHGDYPAIVRETMAEPEQRFEVVYRDGRPWLRIDREDLEMLDYEPTEEDLAWDPERLLRRFLTPDECVALGVRLAEPGGD